MAAVWGVSIWGVYSDVHITVTKMFGHNFQVYTAVQEHCCVAVTELMQCHILELRSFGEAFEVLIYRIAVTVVPSCGHKHHFGMSEIITEGEFQLFNVVPLSEKDFFQLLSHTDDADTALGLRIGQIMLSTYISQRMVYGDRVVLEVNVLPRKTETFSRTHSRVQQHLDDTLEVLIPRLAFKVSHEPFELVLLQSLVLTAFLSLRQYHVTAGSVTDKALLCSSAEDALHNDVQLLDSRRVQIIGLHYLRQPGSVDVLDFYVTENRLDVVFVLPPIGVDGALFQLLRSIVL